MSAQMTLFGEFTVTDDGRPLTFPTERSQALLAYLALHPHQPQKRIAIGEILWTNRTGNESRSNLRMELSRLRHALPAMDSPWLESDRNTVTFVGNRSVVDVLNFQTLITDCQEHDHPADNMCHACAERMAQAIALYRNAFLPDLYLEGNLAFEGWVLTQRERFQQQALDALDNLIAYHERQDNQDAVITFAQRQLLIAPWQESGHQSLMRAYTLTGQRLLALRQYEILTKTLMSELAIDPCPESQVLYDQIRPGADIPTTVHKTPAPHQKSNAPEHPHPPDVVERAARADRLVTRLAGLPGSDTSCLPDASLPPDLASLQKGKCFCAEQVLSFCPGSRPFHALAGALLALSNKEIPLAQFAQDLRKRYGLLCHVARVSLHLAEIYPGIVPPPRLLILMDATEKRFILCGDVAEWERCLNCLLDPLHRPSPRQSCKAIFLSTRGDAMEQGLAHRSMANRQAR